MNLSMEARLRIQMENNPSFRASIEEILEIVEAPKGILDNANDAEDRLIDSVRKFGNRALSCWAENKLKQQVESAKKEDPQLRPHSKKN